MVSVRQVTSDVRICLVREVSHIRLSIELPNGSGLALLMLPDEFDHFLNVGAAIFTGIETHVHMAFDTIKREPALSWKQHDLN